LVFLPESAALSDIEYGNVHVLPAQQILIFGDHSACSSDEAAPAAAAAAAAEIGGCGCGCG
jgi:hypothetical protein